jgi:fucose 4-O-acetylase-like acetyltransferase
MEREKEMDVMLAIGIIYVVLGHSYQPGIIPFPAYAFHMALFFFISGYFFAPKFSIKDKFGWIRGKFLKLVVPYYILNLLFLGITIFLKVNGINLGTDLSWSGFFIRPFVDGHQYILFNPAWFIIQLFIVHLIFQIIYLSRKKIYPNILLFVFLGLALFGIFHDYPQTYTGPSTLWQFLIRTSFALFFYSLGFTFFQYRVKLKKILLNPITFILSIAAYALLDSFFGPTTYELAWAKFPSDYVFTPILSSIICIIFFYNVSCAFAKLFPKDNFVYKIGQNTFAIMVFHIFIFFIINCVLYSFGLFDKSSLSIRFFRFDVQHLWFIYSGLGILVPTLMSISYKKLKEKIKYKSNGPFPR